jgi:hypothetical protein
VFVQHLASATPPDSPLEPIVPDHPHNPFHDPILQLALLQSPLSLGLRTPSSQSAYNTPQLSAASTPRPLPATLLLPFPEHHTMQHLGEQSIAGRAFQYAKFGGGDATAARQHAMHLQHYVAGVRAVELLSPLQAKTPGTFSVTRRRHRCLHHRRLRHRPPCSNSPDLIRAAGCQGSGYPPLDWLSLDSGTTIK